MKTLKIFFTLFVTTVMFAACDDNEIMPSYQKKGTATTTVATVTPSDAKPAQAVDITITLTYVNHTSDPLKTVELKAKIGSGAYTSIQTFDAQSDPKDSEVVREVTYTTPNAAGTVTFDMVITSQMPYPQIKRTSVSVQ